MKQNAYRLSHFSSVYLFFFLFLCSANSAEDYDVMVEFMLRIERFGEKALTKAVVMLQKTFRGWRERREMARLNPMMMFNMTPNNIETCKGGTNNDVKIMSSCVKLDEIVSPLSPHSYCTQLLHTVTVHSYCMLSFMCKNLLPSLTCLGDVYHPFESCSLTLC